MLFCLISLHYVNGINKVTMMMMMSPAQSGFFVSKTKQYFVNFLMANFHEIWPSKIGKLVEITLMK